MGFCKKERKKRPPLKARQGPYKKTNAYTIKFCFQQIMTFFLAILVIVLHSIFVVAAIVKIDQAILYILLALNYFLVIGLIISYVQITRFDPVDEFIIDPDRAEMDKYVMRRKYCHLCRSFIHEKSYHCKRCARCTEDFDHHCVYLNSCIGSKNYELFMRILMFYILFLVNNIGQAVWVFLVALSNSEVKAVIFTHWMEVAIIAICGIQLIATLVLLSFHCYISCCLDVTTLMFIESETKSQVHQIPHLQTNMDEPSPNSFILKNNIETDHTRKSSFQHSGAILV